MYGDGQSSRQKYCLPGCVILSSKVQEQTCAECQQAMARVKGEPLSRIACANCLYAHQQVSLGRMEAETKGSFLKWWRCPECGRWCWTRQARAAHRRGHGFAENH